MNEDVWTAYAIVFALSAVTWRAAYRLSLLPLALAAAALLCLACAYWSLP